MFPVRAVVLVAAVIWCGCQQDTVDPVEGLQVFTGARLFDGTGSDTIDDGVLVIRGGRIESVGPASDVTIPPGARQYDVAGRTIVPGLINAHGHVGGTLGLETDQFNRQNLLRQLSLYARYGITTVNSLGGDREISVQIRDEQKDPGLQRSRLMVAGSVVSGETSEAAAAMAVENADMSVDFIKFRVDDFLGRGRKMTPGVYGAIIDRAHELKLPVAAHMVNLEDTRDLVKAGVDFLAHSIRDQEVDTAFVDLLRERQIPYCPTLTRELSTFAYEAVPSFFEDDFFLREVDPDVLVALKDADRMATVRRSEAAQWYKEHLQIAMKNLKKLSDGGALIAFGTDTGPPGRFQGYFEHVEMDMMAEAGLSAKQILMSATGNAAKALNRRDIGMLKPGAWADFVVLGDDPLADISNMRSIESVWIAGNRVPDKL